MNNFFEFNDRCGVTKIKMGDKVKFMASAEVVGLEPMDGAITVKAAPYYVVRDGDFEVLKRKKFQWIYKDSVDDLWKTTAQKFTEIEMNKFNHLYTQKIEGTEE